MSPATFLLLPIVIVPIAFVGAGIFDAGGPTGLGAVVFIFGGLALLLRGPDGVTRAMGGGAIITGSLAVLVLVAGRFFGVGVLAYLPFSLFLLASFSLAVWIASLADCAVNEPGQNNDKLVWVIIIVFTHVLGAVLYLLLRRPRRIDETGR